MESLQFIGFFFFSFLLIIFYKLILGYKIGHKNLPPSPPSLPIIGHFHLLKAPLPRALHTLSRRYGPVLFLRFGQRPVLLLSTPSAIEESFTKNDIIFSNRPCFASRKQLDYNFTSIGGAPYGHLWRNLRRFAALEIFSSRCLQMSSSIRMGEIRFLTKQLFKSSTKGVEKVEIKSLFNILAFNVMIKMLTGKRYFEDDDLNSDETIHRLDDIKQTFSPSRRMGLGDYFPFLRWFAFCEAKQLKKLHRKRDSFLQALIDAHRNIRSSSSSIIHGERRPIIIDTMLSLQELEPEFYTDDIIKGIILLMLIAGTDTSASTLESAISLLVSHPCAIEKARNEINENVNGSRMLEEGDVAKLTYLHCVVNETLRLGPVGQSIPPREASDECVIGGFDIPKGTMLLVDSWALHKDPQLWEDPTIFKPERFEGPQAEKGGLKFMPFGLGRRQCLGAGLAMRLMILSLGTLIQCFEWEKVEKTGLRRACLASLCLDLEKLQFMYFLSCELLLKCLTRYCSDGLIA